MSERIFNFSAGPAVLPEAVLEEARDNLLSLGESGIGVLEHSHRGPAMIEVFKEAESLCRQLASIPDNYRVLFLQGGASTQFAVIPMSFLHKQSTADYLVTGSWSEKAVHEAKAFGTVQIVCDGSGENFSRIPAEREYSDSPAYVHFTSNNTIFGTQFATEPTPPGNAPLICDASSDIFSREIDISKYALIYAGAQKNLGPSGVTLVIIRDDLVERGARDIPTMFQYRVHAKADSCYNTPPTFGVYLMKLIFQWILDQGGLAGVQKVNERKAQMLYHYLDRSELFRPTADPASRSRMNVTFVTGDPELDQKFIAFATERKLDGLKGHR
ncbi:MAG TPA: 3-phosphoserine/phosphohydroxythreonine transaminase, partial [Planctomycetaceae bacterium]|nr:3-phosphoserine/phosphohydroxythreonine transaminase [Planctomycetaceae bacterium]